MMDELFRAAKAYNSARETYFRMPESQKKIVKPDYDLAEKKLKKAFNAIIDKRIQEFLKNVKLPKKPDESEPAPKVLNEKREIDELDELEPNPDDPDAPSSTLFE